VNGYVRTGGAHTCRIDEMFSLFVFLVNIISHLVARDAERFGVGKFYRGVKTTPKDNSAYEKTGKCNQAKSKVQSQAAPHTISTVTSGLLVFSINELVIY